FVHRNQKGQHKLLAGGILDFMGNPFTGGAINPLVKIVYMADELFNLRISKPNLLVSLFDSFLEAVSLPNEIPSAGFQSLCLFSPSLTFFQRLGIPFSIERDNPC